MRTLILNIFSRNSEAVILGLKEKHVLFGATDLASNNFKDKMKSFFAPAALEQLYFYRDPGRDITGFKEDILKIIKTINIDIIIATGTVTTTALSLLKDELGKHTMVPVENFKTFNRLNDKWNFYKVCRELELPFPETCLYHSQDREAFLGNNSFPLVVKPRVSAAREGFYVANNPEELSAYVRENEEKWRNNSVMNFQNPIIQEFVSTSVREHLYDVAIVANKGKVISCFSQQRLVTACPQGGGGIVNLTKDISEIKEYSEKIVNHLCWTGVVEFDFIQDTQGNYLFLEANPKIWGTTKLAVVAGLNIPELLVNAFTSSENVASQKSKDEVMMKWLIPEGINFVLAKPLSILNISRRLGMLFKKYGARKVYNSFFKESFLYKILKILQGGASFMPKLVKGLRKA